MHQMHHMAPWVPTFAQAIENEHSLNENSPPFVAFQLATVDSHSGFPKNRTLIHRGWLFDDKSSNVLTFTTDKRMAKYEELLHDDRFEAVYWFPKINKQFRFRGKARIVDDTYTPVISNDRIVSSSLATPSNASEESLVIGNGSVKPVSPQKTPINSSLCSPGLASQMSLSTVDLSYTNLARFQYQAPSLEEWEAERVRQWKALSKNLKKSFRKPTPLLPMNDELQKKIDSIRRGVDGKKEDDGLKNFAVVAMFIDHVDLYELDKDRRLVYERDSYQQWVEQEVCP
ncbi:uncharacterized protein CANTADRAFT_47368 [Suhomyces tanzawaensis NRRL Y-17324]|uniref:Pyridoxamine 5'-phosphate oxidase Alr4036 family FMN-binding domain-containing protein n=1 Tax=Suhomyces tanzawaensis NRRL Y-17324 TaxID=984487 RepID=A0A1E4SM36_9ASCO|nr:uncharacterized protein CANTADRAFT_47368 [Suhomyces tanzawaensis NRRL Y-17324]ODV80589.1 hypothetical protein CANTADRAFT_47368 [Suhomyces tanzawaensis NRRL Y-17324]